MHFDRYYYPALELINKNKSPLRLNQIALTGLDSSYLKSIYDELLSEGYCEINDNHEFISLTEKGSQYLIDNNPNPENKELHIRILEYLRDNYVYAMKLDIVTPFLHEVSTYDDRYNLVKVVRQLKEDEYINCVGDENVLCGRSSGRYTALNPNILKASITDKGRYFLDPKPVAKPHVTHNTTNNIHNSVGTVIGDRNEVYQPSLSQENSLNSPKTTINNAIDKRKTSLIEILSWIGGIIGGLYIIYLVAHNHHWISF